MRCILIPFITNESNGQARFDMLIKKRKNIWCKKTKRFYISQEQQPFRINLLEQIIKRSRCLIDGRREIIWKIEGSANEGDWILKEFKYIGTKFQFLFTTDEPARFFFFLSLDEGTSVFSGGRPNSLVISEKLRSFYVKQLQTNYPEPPRAACFIKRKLTV